MPDAAAPWRAIEDAPSLRAGADGASAEPAAQAPTGRPGNLVWIVAAVAVAAVVAGIALLLVVTSGHGSIVVEGDGPGPARSGHLAAAGADASRSVTAELVVDVQGAVVRPGIVRLPVGSRVADAIAAAGGFGPRVAADRVAQALNLAAELKDGAQVVVPSRDDPAAPSVSGGGSASASGGSGGSGGLIDLNRATAAELDGLPGIGPVTAAKIIAARDEQPFSSVDELKSRKVLGAATFDKVKDLVVVR